MIFGLSGKIGAGKDEVGRIIQYLTRNDSYSEMSYETFNSLNGLAVHHPIHKWQVKKFAGKLKEIVSILTGCTIEELESQEFKAKQLEEEWNYIKKYSDKKFTSGLVTDEDAEFLGDRVCKYTYREILQKIGTESMRDVIHENVWVNALFTDYLTPHASLDDKPEMYPSWIVTDMRFPNEKKAIENRNGITIRVDRPNFKNSQSQMHISETSLDNLEFNYYICNDSTIENLIEQVKNILIKEKII